MGSLPLADGSICEKKKSKIKANIKPSIVEAKLKGKAQPKGKANVKGNAYGQGQAQPQEPVSSSGAGSKGSKGGKCIKPSQPLGKLGSQAVKYQMKALVAIDPEENTPS